MASMFRASPWVTYQHPDTSTTTSDSNSEGQAGQLVFETGSNGSSREPQSRQQKQQQAPPDLGPKTLVMDMDMDVDVEMEAPQISTLREEESPPPQPVVSPSKKSATPRKPRTPKVKITMAAAAPGEANGSGEGASGKKGGTVQGKAGEDAEEDQLIDDDAPPSISIAGRTPDATPSKKKAVTKRKTKKEKEKEAALKLELQHDDSVKKSDTVATAASHQPTEGSSSQITVEGTSQPEPIILRLSTAGKKKQASTPRKTTSTRGRGRGGKAKAALISHVLADDPATSEAGYTGTAPSSPGTAQLDLPDTNDGGTPEPDNTTVAQSSPPLASAPLPDDAAASLESVAIPQYPLPTKPFPVQLPIKIASGFAPSMSLDKSNKKVRHWRTANREIRGIAGGRWFAKTWVGDKESEYASAHGIPEENAVKMLGSATASVVASKIGNHVFGMSVSAPTGRGRGRGGSKAASSAAGSAAQSRAGSVLGEPPTASAARPPTKMRILQLAPSENGDSDMAPPES